MTWVAPVRTWGARTPFGADMRKCTDTHTLSAESSMDCEKFKFAALNLSFIHVYYLLIVQNMLIKIHN